MEPQKQIHTTSRPPTQPAMPPPGPIGGGDSPGARAARERTARSQALAAAAQYASGYGARLTRESLWDLVADFEEYLTTGRRPSHGQLQANAAGNACIVRQEGP